MTRLLLALALLQVSVPVTTIDRGEMSGIDQPMQQVVRSAEEWRALWTRHESARPLPFVDFSKEMVAIVAAGSRPSSAWEVTVTGAESRDGGLVIRYSIQGPRPGQMAAAVITTPYHFVKLPRVDGDVRFEKAGK